MKVLPPSRPFARGVSQLMYVGDDEAVERACSGSDPRIVNALEWGGLALAAYLLWKVLK